MARLIEVQDAQVCSSPMIIMLGDLVQFSATGGRVRNGRSLECIGAFISSVIGDDGNVFVPSGLPNKVLFRATHHGECLVDVFTGDPFHGSRIITMTIDVIP